MPSRRCRDTMDSVMYATVALSCSSCCYQVLDAATHEGLTVPIRRMVTRTRKAGLMTVSGHRIRRTALTIS